MVSRRLEVELAPESSDRCRFCFREVCSDCEGCIDGKHVECRPCVCDDGDKYVQPELECKWCGNDFDSCICTWDDNGFEWGD